MEVGFDGIRVVRGGREVLSVPALRFTAGTMTAILGPNGAGKSTLLRTVAGLERPVAGTVSIGGRTDRRGRKRTSAVAYAFQEPVFVRGSVGANFDLALRMRGVDAPTRRARIAEVAAACGIGQLLERDVRGLSGGEAQRANLARALSLRAPVTLLDEPLSGLDRPVRQQLLFDLPGLLREFATTTLLVTHELDEAVRLAEEMVVVLGGRVHAAGPKREVLTRPSDPETAAFLGYTLLPKGGVVDAVAPGALRAPGDELPMRWPLKVTSLLDLGTHREVAGTVGGARVSARWAGEGTVAAGDVLIAGARAEDVLEFPA